MYFSNNPLVLGENNSNLPRILTVIVEAFEKGAFDDTTDKDNVKHRLINILKFMQVLFLNLFYQRFSKFQFNLTFMSSRFSFYKRTPLKNVNCTKLYIAYQIYIFSLTYFVLL